MRNARKSAWAVIAAIAWMVATCGPASAQFAAPRAKANVPKSMGNVISSLRKPESVEEKQRRTVQETTRGALARIRFMPQQQPTATIVQQTVTSYAPTQSFQMGYGRSYTADDCEIAIKSAEGKFGLPPYLLHAIALTESGRDGRPSPHAMNIMGKAYFASGTDEMQKIVGRYGDRSSIDIGCMQVNLKFHADRFKDWRSLLNPTYNAEYAALYLTELKREFGTWTRAVAAYHSRTSWKGANYVCLVTRRYGQIFGSDRPGCGPNLEMMVSLLYQSGGRG